MSKRKHPSSRRKPQTAHEQDDAFVASAIDFSEWAATHRQALMLVAIAFGLLVAGGIYSSPQTTRIFETALRRAESSFLTIVRTQSFGTAR